MTGIEPESFGHEFKMIDQTIFNFLKKEQNKLHYKSRSSNQRALVK